MPQSSALSPQSLSGWRMRDDNPNEWIWTPRAKRRHDLSDWLPVEVPTSVQEALWKAGQIPHPYHDLNSRAAEWVEHRDWIFGLDFNLSPPPSGYRTFIDFESVADDCLIYLNGTLVGRHEGPGAPFDFEIGPLLHEGGNQLFVVVRSPHQEDPQTGWTERTRSLRGRIGFGWDFAPRLVALGILGPVSLRHTRAHRLRDLWARPRLTSNLSTATVELSVRVDGPLGATVRFDASQGRNKIAPMISSSDSNGIARATLELPRPQLWWPNGLGEQPLYTVRAECIDNSDSISSTFGLRELRWQVRPGGADGEWPLMLMVNGQPVFQRGWNWVPTDCMGGPHHTPRTTHLLKLAQDAHVNILRCWGGADPETQAFYDECDRLGILVWQEFPLSSAGISNTPPADPDYLQRMAIYARDVVTARRNHPSLALWGGGNELSGADGEPLTLAHPYSETLDAVIREHDPDRTFRPSSPLGPTADADPEQSEQWDVHGPWEYSQRQPGPQYWRINAVTPALHSEIGAPGMASLDTQHRYLSPPHRSRRSNNPAWRHHGGAWWDHQSTVEQLFGPIEDDALAVLTSQWLQAETLRYYIEETRRRWPRSGGIYPWQLNEPWPNMACTSAVEYTGRPKLAYYAVRNAYCPTIATARYPALMIQPGDPLRAEVWALNDASECQSELHLSLRDLSGTELVPQLQEMVSLPASTSLKLLDLEIPLSDFTGVALLELSLAGQENTCNRYLFSNTAQPPLRAALEFPQALAAMFDTNQ